MKKILFLSSAFIMTTLGAYAADGIITGGAGTCTVDVLGVSDNNATANTIATWSLNDYECGAGQYLDEDTLTCTTCPAGSYCPGGTFTIENAASGTFDCPAGYTESAAGAGTNNECYTACTVANANIEHATAVSGNDYYGTTDADTCAATDCELGYHVDGGEIEVYEKTPLVPVDYHERHIGSACIVANGETTNSTTLTVAEAGLTEKNTWARQYDNGLVYGRASCQPQRATDGYSVSMAMLFFALGETTMDEAYVFVKNTYGKLKADSWKYMVEQRMAENITDSEFQNWLVAVFFVNNDAAEYNTTDIGTQCWCQITDFMPTNGDKTAIVSAPWVWDGNFSSEDACADSCANVCADFSLSYEEDDIALAAAMYGALDYRIVGGMCKVTETDCPAGTYYKKTSTTLECAPCPDGSFCPGGLFTIDSTTNGTNACPAGYPKSDVGAGADTQCYKNCEVSDIPHAYAVAGNDYYGTGTDTCTATECVKGYHTDGRIQFVEKTPAVNVDFDTVNGVAVKNGNGEEMNNNLPNAGLTENNTIAVSFTNGILYGRASCQPTVDVGTEYMFNNMNAAIDGSMSIEDFRAGLEPLAGVAKTNFAVEYINAMKSGNLTDEEQTQWGNKLGAVFLADKNAGYSTSSTGQYCYIRADAFQPNGVNKIDITGTPWMLYPEPFESADECAANCIMDGTEVFMQIPDVAFGALDYAEVATCTANTINIDWNPDNGGAHTQNMCTYDGEITLPDEPVKVGYTFSGWKLVEPNSTPVQ